MPPSTLFDAEVEVAPDDLSIYLEIEIPLPPVGCAQNTRRHWMVRMNADEKHRKETREAAAAVLQEQGLPTPAFRSIDITSVWYCAKRLKDKRYRPRDGVNAQGALKAALDGLVDAGLVADDDDKALGHNRPKMLRTDQEHGGRACIVLQIKGTGEPTPAMVDAWKRKQEARIAKAEEKKAKAAKKRAEDAEKRKAERVLRKAGLA